MNRPNRTALNMGIVSAATLLQIVNQFFLFGILAAYFGASAESDALTGALVLPTVLAAIITGSMAYVLIPELVAKFETRTTGKLDSETEAWQLASYVGLVTTVISLVATLVLMWGATSICGWLYHELDSSEQLLTVRLMRILSVQVVLNGLISWAQSVNHSRHQFLLPALGGVLGTGASLVLAYRWGDRGIHVIAWAINVGSLVSVMVHLWPILPRLRFPKAESQSLWRLIGLFWPLLLGSAFLRLDPVVDRVLASELTTGSMAHINFAQRIMMALLAIGTSTLSVVAFPQLAARLASAGEEGFAEHFSLAFRRLVLIAVPIVLGFSCFAHEIIGDLLQRGQFTRGDTRVVSQLVLALMGMFIGASAGELLARAFYVLGDTRTPTAVGVAALVLGLVLKIILFRSLGVLGIACGVSAYLLTSAAVMAIVLTRRVNQTIFAGSVKVITQSMMSAIFACGCCYAVYAWPLGNTWLAAPVGAMTYGAGLLASRNSDAWQLWWLVCGKLRRG